MRRFLVAALLTFLATAPAAAAKGPGAAPSGTPGGPRAVDFELPVHGAGKARAAGAVMTLRPRRPFDVFGLTRGSGHVHARVFDPRMGWRRWVEIHSRDAVWAGGATALQLRGKVRGRVHFVRITGRPAPVARAAAGEQPPVVPRSDWAGDQCDPRSTPSYGEVDLAFIHHTVTANEYAPEDSRSMVLGVCRFHRNSNGWNDIGYNFLVDKYGQIFEGRAGGIDRAVVGAQAQGYNSVSTGISNLGTYSDVPQTDAALDAMARLLAWKLPLHGAPVEGTVAVTSAGGSSNRYPSGREVTFERISGHRDGNSTACPGDQLHAQLPRLRELAAGRAPLATAPPASDGVPAALTLLPAAPAFSFPLPVAVNGRLTDAAGAGVAGRRIQVQIGTTKGWRTVTEATTGDDGAWSAQFAATRTWDLRAFAGFLTSPRTSAVVVPTMSARIALPRIQAGRSAVITGAIRPRKPSVLVEGWRQVVGSGRYVRAFTLRRPTSSTGRFRAAIRLRRPGLYRLRARFPGDRRNGAAQAADVYVRAVRSLSAGTGGQGAR